MSDPQDVIIAYNWHSELGHLVATSFYRITGEPEEASPHTPHGGIVIEAATGCSCGRFVRVPLGGDFTCECGRVFRAQVLIEYREAIG